MEHADHPGSPLDERADCGALILADDQISFPMPRLGAVLGRERPLVNREHRLLKSRPTLFCALMSAPVISPGAQR
jgi:hypothetical protein